MEVRENVAYKGSEFAFQTVDGRKQLMHITQCDRLGEGNFGEIFAVTLAVREELHGILHDAGSIERALKVFHIQENARHAVAKHDFLRRYRFPLFEEYREDAGNRGCVLMPNGNRDGRVVVSWNRDSSAYETLRKQRPLSCESIRQTQASLLPYVHRATAFGFYVPPSAYFFHVPSDQQVHEHIPVSFDDTDEVDECFRGADLVGFNVRGAQEALLALCTCGMQNTERNTAASAIQKTCEQWQEQIAWEIERMMHC
ncbi:MAG: hypothetical protein PHU04_04210 [Candidatus Peribacteraceae bacterium]|nr:hypothetical protein [Candidatus Peribacteraceae bacterium]